MSLFLKCLILTYVLIGVVYVSTPLFEIYPMAFTVIAILMYIVCSVSLYLKRRIKPE